MPTKRTNRQNARTRREKKKRDRKKKRRDRKKKKRDRNEGDRNERAPRIPKSMMEWIERQKSYAPVFYRTAELAAHDAIEERPGAFAASIDRSPPGSIAKSGRFLGGSD